MRRFAFGHTGHLLPQQTPNRTDSRRRFWFAPESADRRSVNYPFGSSVPVESRKTSDVEAAPFTPGPTPVPKETLLELAKPVTYHRTAEQKQILGEVMEDLKYVYQTKNDVLA